MDFTNILKLSNEFSAEIKNDQITKRAKLEASSQDPSELNFDQALAMAIYNIPMSVGNRQTLVFPPISNIELNEAFVNNLEIEARIGMLVQQSRRFLPRNKRKKGIVIDGVQRQQRSLKFESGIDESVLKHIKAKIDKKEFDMIPMKKTIVYSQDMMGGNRVHIDENSLKSGNPEDVRGWAETKEKMFEVNIALTCHEYDMRITANSEISKDKIPVPISVQQYQTERVKRRWTYINKRFNKWQVDLTEVSTRRLHSCEAEVSKEIELEFELRPEKMKRWLLEQDPAVKEQLSREITVELVFLLDFFVACEVHPMLADVAPDLLQEPLHTFIRSHPQYDDVEKRVKKMNLMLQSPSSASFPEQHSNHDLEDKFPLTAKNNKLDFLGAMPVNFFRSNLSNVLENDYFVTEKTDGTRYLLYAMQGARNEPKLFFLDRARCFFTWPDSEFLAATLCSQQLSTVLDGEFVFDFSLRQYVFMVFDVLCYMGRRYTQRPFAERIACINNEIMPTIVQAVMARTAAAASAPSTAFPRLMDKKFVRKQQFRELLGQIKDYVYNDRCGRHHMTDGLIFQPNVPYVFSRHFDLMKWKWSELRSVDLIVELRDSGNGQNSDVMLLCSGPDNTRVNCSLRGDKNYGLGKFDCYRLLAERQQLLNERSHRSHGHSHQGQGEVPGQVIAEVTYDSGTGYWCFHKLRKDKTEPNYLNSVLGVFMEQAEALTQDELEFIVVANVHGQENDYDAHMRKMKNQLLDWQRKTYK